MSKREGEVAKLNMDHELNSYRRRSHASAQRSFYKVKTS